MNAAFTGTVVEPRFKVKMFEDSLKEEWDSFVEKKSVNGTFLHTRKFYDHNPLNAVDDSSFLFYKDNKLIAVVALNLIKAEDGLILESFARATYGGFVFRNGLGIRDTVIIVNQLIAEARKLQVKEIVIKNPYKIIYKKINEVFDYAMWFYGFSIKHRELEISITIDDKRAIQSRYSEGARSGVHKAQKLVTIQESEDYLTFWCLLESNLQEKYDCKPTHNYYEFLNLLQSVGSGNIKLFTASYRGSIVAGIVVFVLNDRCIHAQYIAHDKKFQSLRPLNALIDFILHWGSDFGFKYFNLGMANENKGRTINYSLFKFKESYGGHGILRETMHLKL